MNAGIVGGGIGGLITALYLRKQGKEVTIYEKSSRLGGRLNFFEKEGYKIDSGPTIVLLPEMIYEILSEVGIERDELELILCSPMYKLNYPDGSHFYKTSDLPGQLNEIKRMFPGEEQGFLRYVTDMYERFHQGKTAFLDRSFVNRRDFWTPKNLHTLTKLKAYQSVKKLAQAYFSHPRMQEAFSFQTLYIGGSPENSPAMYSLVPFSEHAHGIWYVKGGYGSVVDLLQRKLVEQGVEIRLSTPVEALSLQGNFCNGVVTEEGTHLHDMVIYNGDFPGIHRLIPGPKPVKKNYESSSGCFLLYLGLDRIFDEADVHQFFMTDHFDEHMREVFLQKKLPRDPAIYTFYPSKIDPSLAPEGKSVLYVLVPVPSGETVDWELEKQSYADFIIDSLEKRGYPGLKDSIVWSEIRTPNDALTDGLYQGGSFGIAPTLKQSGVFRPQIKPLPYENLYAVGASIHPGGGVPIVMQSAKHLAKYLERA
ncbi:phytoene desaturase family protein [Fictibacillus phosphorivorans]|uniref:phytoene desaturase family protein n=1 Tax=Fictibacillus phosphorivorans TaxID=1221500 RepID=UPI0012932C7A|nr:phytoene desaturase family protein [Fictibacillus phosphorivorans]MQR96050.1 phytoene desaturase [Fictibacillus phosphorivorans]